MFVILRSRSLKKRSHSQHLLRTKYNHRVCFFVWFSLQICLIWTSRTTAHSRSISLQNYLIFSNSSRKQQSEHSPKMFWPGPLREYMQIITIRLILVLLALSPRDHCVQHNSLLCIWSRLLLSFYIHTLNTKSCNQPLSKYIVKNMINPNC